MDDFLDWLDKIKAEEEEVLNFCKNNMPISNYEEALSLVSKSGDCLNYFSDDLKNNIKVVVKALENRESAFEFVGLKVKEDKDVVIKLLNYFNKTDSIFKFSTETLKKDKDFCLAAIKAQKQNIKFFDNNLMCDIDIIKTALLEGYHFKNFPDEVRGDLNVIGILLSDLPDCVKTKDAVCFLHEAILLGLTEELYKKLGFLNKGILNRVDLMDYGKDLITSLSNKNILELNMPSNSKAKKMKV